jgi:hypothetical protein
MTVEDNTRPTHTRCLCVVPCRKLCLVRSLFCVGDCPGLLSVCTSLLLPSLAPPALIVVLTSLAPMAKVQLSAFWGCIRVDSGKMGWGGGKARVKSCRGLRLTTRDEGRKRRIQTVRGASFELYGYRMGWKRSSKSFSSRQPSGSWFWSNTLRLRLERHIYIKVVIYLHSHFCLTWSSYVTYKFTTNINKLTICVKHQSIF